MCINFFNIRQGNFRHVQNAGTKYSVMDKDSNDFNTDDYSAMVKKLVELLDA